MKKSIIKVTGVKKAVGDYNRANAGGCYDARYGKLMLDCNTGKLWTDEFYDLGHNSWIVYHDNAVINLVSFIYERVQDDFKVNMSTVKKYAEKAIAEFNR